jgi:hypothetical protein
MGALLYQQGFFRSMEAMLRRDGVIFAGTGCPKVNACGAVSSQRITGCFQMMCSRWHQRRRDLRFSPQRPQFRLCTDANERFGTLKDARFNVDKLLVPMNEGYGPIPMPLKAIHILEYQESGDPKIVSLRGFDRVNRLIEKLYRPTA